MFQDGGLKDQGNTTDPVSGNDVPSGSLKEEVRDDIDAKLSPGEFVFPADVVRFIGLEKLMMIRDKAKKGLSRMEEMGQMGNSDEATIDDDVPFGMEDLIIVSGGPENEMSKGGVPSYGRGGQLIGDIGDGYQPPTRYHNPATGQEMMVTKIAGKFFPPLPKGFVPKPTIAQANPTSSTRVGTTSVIADDKTDESVAGFDVNNANVMTPQESASGEMRGNAGTEKSFNEMSPNELAAYGDWARDNPMKAQLGAFLGNTAEYLSANPPSPISTVAGIAGYGLGKAADMLGMTRSAPSFPATPGSIEDITGVPPARSDYDPTAVPGGASKVRKGDKDLAAATKAANKSDIEKAAAQTAFNKSQMDIARRKSLANDIPAVSLTQINGVTGQDVAGVAEAISRGNAPPGAIATGPDTYTIGGYEVDYKNNEIRSGPKSEERVKAVEAQVEKEKANIAKVKETVKENIEEAVKGYGATGGPDAPADGEAIGGTDDSQSDDTGPDNSEQDNPDNDVANVATGGFVSKKLKKKQKKMKRGGLASRK